MSKAKEGDKEAAEPAKKSKKMLLIIIVVAVLALGGGAYFVLKPSGEEPPPEPGEVLALDAITVNLTEGHFLKLKLALQATLEVTEDVDGSKALDLAVDQFSNLSVAELGNEGRAKHKAELKEKIVEAYEGDVMDVYLTDFVMQ
ncbi:flagellar basal body-associated FliL family protein [Actinophytocola xanthii]|uniref:Flagellar protein FliL n=1 Tax=Actinophytocola xanthii TaxID=1912961 RepID=A0A1Q8BXS0_9PSEU|nr:flagellar basal body-associated FliL family protein [Actinophytocola xanthii]OLF06906.1 flagellar basal body-associated protein FliL [Actinophytocola xanthii]